MKYCKDCQYWCERDIYNSLSTPSHCTKEIFVKNEDASSIIGDTRGRNKRIYYFESNKNNDCQYFMEKEKTLFQRIFKK